MNDKSEKEIGADKNVFIVNHYKSVCIDEGVDLCYVVKMKPDGPWTFMDAATLKGLENYTWGNVYKVEVVRHEQEDHDEDRPSAFYQTQNVSVIQEAVKDTFEILLRDTERSYLSLREQAFFFMDEVKVWAGDNQIQTILAEALKKGNPITGQCRHQNASNEILLFAIQEQK